jgi:hypothetical protein
MGSPKPDFSGLDGKMLGLWQRPLLANPIVISLSYPNFRIKDSFVDNRGEAAMASRNFFGDVSASRGMSMTEASLKTGMLEPGAVEKASDAGYLSHEEWLDFAARMDARRPMEKEWENTGITVEQSIDALRVAVEEDLLAFLDLDHQ